MDILDRVTKALAKVGKMLPQSFLDRYPGLEKEMTEALAEFNHVRTRTVVLTFEKAKDVADGRHAVLFFDEGNDVETVCFAVCGGVHPEDGDFASCPLPELPGPEVFRKG